MDTLNQEWSRQAHAAAGRGKLWSGQWEGFVTAPITGRVVFHVTSDSLASVAVQKKRIISSEGIERSGSVVLEKGRRYPIKIRYTHRQGDSFLRVLWSWDGRAKCPITNYHLTHSPAQDEQWERRLQNPSGQHGAITNRALPQPLTDWSMWPQSYSVLMNEKAMFPVDLTFWKARIDTSRQLFVDNHLLAGSRDGRHWYYLGNREPFIPAGRDGDWDTHYMRMVNLATTGGPVEMGDELWFYYWGRDQGESFPEHRLHLGIGTLRKDGFASLNAGAESGAVATRPLVFDGKGRLFVNAQTSPEGYVKASVLDEFGNDIDGFTVSNCQGVQGDHIQAQLSWRESATLAALKDRHVRIVFHLRNAKLYSFWIE